MILKHKGIKYSDGGNRWRLRYLKYLKSDEWKRLRLSILRDKDRCENCGAKKDLQAHHLSYKRLGHERIEDIKILCKSCHLDIHPNYAKSR